MPDSLSVSTTAKERIAEPVAPIDPRLLLAAIVESSDDAIVSKDLNGIITSWNAAAERMFGYKAEEVIGKPVLILIPKELQDEEPIILSKLRAGERIEHYETRRITKFGEIIDVSLTISPVKDPQGRVIGASKIARDITERKRAQAALIQSEKLAATGRMAAAIAHEINNPLEAVTNLAYLLVHHPSLDQEARNYAQMLLSEISRASEITRQSLAFYRDSTKPSNVSLAELLDNLLDLHQHKFKSKKIAATREFDRSAVVWGYSAELRQVFANLVLNAVDAMESGGTLRVRLRVSGKDRSKVRITVADTGSGVAHSSRRHLFQPFFTTKPNKGNGLGLWVSKGIVEKHRGSIRFRSTADVSCHGTVFQVMLPRCPALEASQVA